jgi:hypothetical protein
MTGDKRDGYDPQPVRVMASLRYEVEKVALQAPRD